MKKICIGLMTLICLTASSFMFSSCETTYTLTFESNGGSQVTSIKQKGGTLLVAPTAPTKTGHTFFGWYVDKDYLGLDEDRIFIFNLMPNENVTLYAKWAVNSYKIVIEDYERIWMDWIYPDGGYYFSSKVINQEYGTQLNIDKNVIYYDKEYTHLFTLTTVPAENLRLYRKW